MTTPQKITAATPPIFPCWLFLPNAKHGWFRLSGGLRLDISECGFTHWHPDQPTAPTSSPGETTISPEKAERMVNDMMAMPAQSQTPMTEKAIAWVGGNVPSTVVAEMRCLETALAAAKEEIVRLARCISDDPHELVELRADRDALAEKLRQLEEQWAVREETLTRVLGERDAAIQRQQKCLVIGRHDWENENTDLRTRLAALQQTVGEADKLGQEKVMAIWLRCLGDRVYPKAHHIDELGKTTRRLTEDRNAAQKELAFIAKDRDDALLHLIVLLPMAKGYASANPVGNNWKMVEEASQFALGVQHRLARQPDQRQGEGALYE